jgi:hypothetical protein
MKSKPRVYSPHAPDSLPWHYSLVVRWDAYTQNEPILVPDAVDYQKLLPILPDAPQGWTADKPMDRPKTSADSESQMCIGTTVKVKATTPRAQRSAYSIRGEPGLRERYDRSMEEHHRDQ